MASIDASPACAAGRLPPGTIQRWSTEVVPPRQRLDFWIGAICEGFLEMSATSPVAERFESTLESAPLGPIGVHRVRGSAQDVYRTRHAIAHSRENFFYLLCKTDAPWSAVQDGHSARLLPGDLVLVDSRRCYEFHFPRSADTVSLELPTAWVGSWLAEPARSVGRRIDGSAGWGRVLSHYVAQLSPETAAAPPLPASLMADQLGSLLALAVEGGRAPLEDATPGAAALRRRIEDAIRERHAEPGLTAGAVAAGIGVSERTLHRALAPAGTPFAQLLGDCRMAVARRMLEAPRFDRLGIAEIGRRVGLSDASHFIRQCRRHLGATPGQLRRGR